MVPFGLLLGVGAHESHTAPNVHHILSCTLRDGIPKKYCCSLKVKIFGIPKRFGLAPLLHLFHAVGKCFYDFIRNARSLWQDF